MPSNGSILNDIKKMLNVSSDDTSFDTDILIHINTALDTLRQLGIGPKNGFEVTGDTETWSDFFSGTQEVPSTKTYIYAKVRIVFDPPSSSFVLEALKALIAEYEWRANVDVETPCLKKG